MTAQELEHKIRYTSIGEVLAWINPDDIEDPDIRMKIEDYNEVCDQLETLVKEKAEQEVTEE